MTRTALQPLDHGIFGPDSVTWKVYRYPTSMTVGFARTALVEMFDPLVVASVAGTGSLRQRATDRYDRTLEMCIRDRSTPVRWCSVTVPPPRGWPTRWCASMPASAAPTR